jgi:Icc-related predicted phosphoesterase
VIRIAAVGDLHIGLEEEGRWRPHYLDLDTRADMLLLAGDLTREGYPEEAELVARELKDLPVPVVAVLGNHDHHSGRPDVVEAVLRDAGIRVLECESTVIDVDGVRVGVAGAKGFGGGFAGASGSEFGEPEMKAFMAHTRAVATGFETALADLDTEIKIGLLHYSPVEETLRGERLEIYPFLGSYLLAEACDRGGADVVFHGHAHRGAERGATPGGVRVRNVAQPVIGHAYHVYTLDPER